MNRISDERREVAARMRGPFDVCGCLGHTYISGTLYGMQVCATDELALRDGMRRLANLIDQTCHVVIPNEMDGECFCSECGALLGEYGYTAYCPCCGARVVSHDDN